MEELISDKSSGKIFVMLGRRRNKLKLSRPKRRSYSSLSRRRNPGGIGLFVLAGLLLLAAAVLTAISMARFKSVAVVYPNGSLIGDIPVGGLSRQMAEERLREAYSIAVELSYQGARVQFSPDTLGLRLETEDVLNQADAQNSGASWWDYLWGKLEAPVPFNIPMAFSQEQGVVMRVLESTFPNRYDQPASATLPVANAFDVIPGEPGLVMVHYDEAVLEIEKALRSPNQRVVQLQVEELPALPMSWENLEIKLRQTIQEEGFNGLVEIYLQDLQDGRVMHFATHGGQDVPVDVAYTGASTVKIPIMVSAMRRLSDPIPATANTWMRAMIQDSLNPPADGLMKNYMDNTTGPLMVTDDMRELGYQNTFLAGFFEPGSPLLRKIETPANTRTDMSTNPDLYNQTVPSEIGDLLAKIYRCGTFDSPEYSLFGGQVTYEECRVMIDNLLSNRIGSLIEVGTSVEARVAHKHGWTSALDGLLHAISDVGIVYSPGGNYVLTIFIYSENQILFERGNLLFARLSQSIYNAYNPDQQAIVYTE